LKEKPIFKRRQPGKEGLESQRKGKKSQARKPQPQSESQLQFKLHLSQQGPTQRMKEEQPPQVGLIC
jgi:hypothetical protein